MKKLVSFDIETYQNYTLFAFRGIESQKVITIETSTKLTMQQRTRLRSIMRKFTTVTFNGNKFDIPLTQYAISGASCYEIWEAVQDVIKTNAPDFITYQRLGLEPPQGFDTIDLSEPAPSVFTSLKTYGTRLGSTKLWELPYDPMVLLEENEKAVLKSYCINDLQVTEDLYHAIKGEIDLRVEMGKEYDQDLRSKSGAQVAEAVLLKETNYRGGKPSVPKVIRYKAPSCVTFDTPILIELKNLLETTSFKVNPANGQPVEPDWMKKFKTVLGGTEYKVGLGGIHDKRKKTTCSSDDDYVLLDIDVASYYPSMIIEFGFTPKHIGKKFLDVYKKIYVTRLKAKREGNKLVSNSLKLVLNSSFGKLGSMYSKLYAPDVMLHVTLTGQLMLLMLIESIEAHGVEVFYANTDGITIRCPRNSQELIETIVFDWELDTGMVMETEVFKSVAIRDVNNFINITQDGKIKCKGAYADTGLSKGRLAPIAFKACKEYLLNGTPLEDTIHDCKDINEFLLARNVRGGGEFNGQYLGKVVRWYWAVDGSTINYKTNGNKVPLSDGCQPLMDLVAHIPDNLDHYIYVEYAIKQLTNLGVSYERKV